MSSEVLVAEGVAFWGLGNMARFFTRTLIIHDLIHIELQNHVDLPHINNVPSLEFLRLRAWPSIRTFVSVS